MIPLFGYIIFIFLSANTAASDDFPDDNLEERIALVNEGTLQFLSVPPKETVHHHQNRITITEQSLVDGWVKLEQCHYHLDPVSAIEIVYNESRIRDLSITSSNHIGASRVVGSTVQIVDVEKNGEICIHAESKALQHLADNYFLLKNGPFMRRFLDGFYPMQISIEVTFPKKIKLIDVFPDRSSGAMIKTGVQTALLEGWFEGKLYTQFRFCSRENTKCNK